MIKKQPPTLADLQSNSNYLREKRVNSLKIHIELKALEDCFEKIGSCTLVMKPPPPPPLLSQIYSLAATT